MRVAQSMVDSGNRLDGFDAGDPVEGREEVLPGRAFARQDLAAFARDPVVAALALSGFLDPAAFDQAAVLEAIERRVERSDVIAEGAVGALADEPGDIVAVARLILDQRQDQEIGAAFLELLGHGIHMWINTIWRRREVQASGSIRGRALGFRPSEGRKPKAES